MNNDIFSLIEQFIKEDEVPFDKVIKGYKPPKNLVVSKQKKKLKDRALNDISYEEDTSQEEENVKEIKPDFSVEEKEELVISPSDLNPYEGNEFEKFIHRFNLLRAAKSLDDYEVRKRLKSYFKELTYLERISLYIFINGMHQICMLSLDEDESASSPSKYGISIDANKKKNKEKEKEEYYADDDFVEKEKYSKKHSSASVTSPISVINVEGKQDKSNIFNRLREINEK